MVWQHFAGPFQWTKHLTVRYWFHHSIWRCYLAAVIHSWSKLPVQYQCRPDVTFLDSFPYAFMFCMFQQLAERNIRLGQPQPLDTTFASIHGWRCLILQVRIGWCPHCEGLARHFRELSRPEFRNWRIDMSIFETRPYQAGRG